VIISFANQKGGVGKTTSVLNLGAYIAAAGHKVLLVDIDPQSNLTSGLGINSAEMNRPSIYDLLINDKPSTEVFFATNFDNLFLIPSNIELAGAEIELVGKFSREQILKNALKNLKKQFDYILIDCPPSLGIITINAFVASDYICIPVQCEYYALEGISQLINTINLVKKGLNTDLQLAGVLMTMFDSRTKLSQEVVDEVKKYFPEKLFDTIIPRNVRLSEAPSHGKPINLYSADSSGAKAYESLSKEFIKKVK
jgi:chromosome partitioning protein